MSGARSVQVLQPNVDGEMSHVIHATNFSYYLGLASTNPDAGPTMMDYSFHFHLGTLYIREKDGHHQPHGTFQEGDTLSIRRSGSTITYWKDSTQLRNTSTNAGDFLFVDASLYTKDMQVQQVFADFCTDSLPLVISASWQHTDCYPTSTGSVMLSVSGGNPPYGYAWSSGETSPGINGKSAGAYTVTVTDNGGNSELLSFELYNKVIWEGLVGAAANADTVYRIVPGGGSWGASGARSDNKLLANINGRMIHIIHSLSYSYYFGLSDQDTDQSPTTIDYTFYNNKGALKIREEQSGFNQWIGTVAIGDTMVVERNGSTVYYYQNGNLLRSVGVNAAETLRVDVSLYSSSTGLHDLYVDFCDTVAGMKRGLTETNSRENAGILIYPNPALSIVVVIWKGIEEWKLDLLDLPGRVLESREVKGEEMKMDLGRRSSGTYLLRLSAPGQIRYRKLVIK